MENDPKKKIIPFVPANYLFFPDFREPHKDRDEIRKTFFELAGCSPEQIRSIPILRIKHALSDTCKKYHGKIEKEIIRIELSDIYFMAGMKITHLGAIRFD